MGPDICCLRFVCSRVHIRQVPSSKPSVIYLIPYRVRKFIFPTRDDTDVRWAQIPPLPPSPPTVRFRFETFNRQSLLSIGSWQVNPSSSTTRWRSPTKERGGDLRSPKYHHAKDGYGSCSQSRSLKKNKKIDRLSKNYALIFLTHLKILISHFGCFNMIKNFNIAFWLF